MINQVVPRITEVCGRATGLFLSLLNNIHFQFLVYNFIFIALTDSKKKMWLEISEQHPKWVKEFIRSRPQLFEGMHRTNLKMTVLSFVFINCRLTKQVPVSLACRWEKLCSNCYNYSQRRHF